MSKVSLIFLLIVSATANATKVEDVLNNYMSAWASHDKVKISSFFAESVVWYDLSTDTSTKGSTKVSKAITDAFMGFVPNMYWVRSGDVFISGNTIIYEWIYGGTFNGNWGEQVIKDKDFSLKGLSTTTINSSGKITSQKDYYDVASFKRALGVGK